MWSGRRERSRERSATGATTGARFIGDDTGLSGFSYIAKKRRTMFDGDPEEEEVTTNEGKNPLYEPAVHPTFEEVRKAFVENFGVHALTWRPLGFNTDTHYKHYLTAKGWWHKLSLKENPDVKRDVSEQYAREAIPALVKSARNGSFPAIKKILDDQCKDWGWGSADIEVAATGAGKTIAELFGAEDKQEEEKT